MNARPAPSLWTIFAVAAALWLIARLIAYANGRSNEEKRIRGLFVPEWIAAFYVALGLYGFYAYDNVNTPFPPALTLPAFSLVIGPIVGLIHGTLLLRARKPTTDNPVIRNTMPEDGNPYRSP
ncbi:hypothetical protein [Rhodopirellula sp. P2]|uniref:hypothetical protein n=1 Tax=Rhodopirellula sp. P2 TaxID=2127060 RepID=UPI002367D198|nr:hypothetical protein [Rhodopirellula sp. P2]WDQ15181.1 hypothetical protein PSR62_16215 [Rhodopirellula sp. P2]